MALIVQAVLLVCLDNRLTDVADTVAHIGETVVKTLKEHGLYDKCHTC